MKLTNTLIAVALATANILTIGSVAQAAGTAAFSASVNPSSITVGSNTTVSLYENGDNVNVVTGKFIYDTSKLQFISSSCVGSFSTASASNSEISCFTSGGTTVSGSQQFASIIFKSIATGNANVTIGTGSLIVSAGANIWNGVASTATVTINAAAATPTPVQPTSTPTPAKPTATPIKPTATPKASSTPVTSKTSTTPTPSVTPTSTTHGQVGGVQASNSATPTPSATPSTVVKDSRSQTPWVVGIIVAILLVAVGAYYFVFRNKKTQNS